MKLFTYSDGSGNSYIITSTSIKYKPVTPDLSSSGTYSGGKPEEKEISEEQYKNIANIIIEAISDNSILIKNRLMGSGQIKIQDADNSSIFILKHGSELKLQIENCLLKLIS